jgi:CobQ-like glutamine amidotransferase family enzyme
MEMELNIVDMYSDVLNMYGDIGNLLAITQRSALRGIKHNVKSFSINQNEKIDYENTDIILIGGGSDNGQNIVSNDLLKQKNSLEQYIENDGVLLAICGSYQMFGDKYQDAEGNNISCLEIFDIETISQKDRLIGNIILENSLGLEPKTLIGFENHGGRTYHNYNTLGTVKVGYGNNNKDKKEGMIYKNFIGTYLHGSFLPKNYHVADHMIFNALKLKYEIDYLKPLNNEIELLAHENMLKKLLSK